MGKFTDYAEIKTKKGDSVIGFITKHNEKTAYCAVFNPDTKKTSSGYFSRYAGHDTKREISKTNYRGFVIVELERFDGEIIYTSYRGGLASSTLEEEKKKIDCFLSHKDR